MARVVESFLQSKKGSPDGGEDRLIVADGRYFGVVDGATDHSGLNWGTESKPTTGGAAVANIIRDVFCDAPPAAKPVLVTEEINARIRHAAAAANIDLRQVQNRADAAFAVYAVETGAIYHIHDCAFGFVSQEGAFDKHHEEKLVDRFASELRAAVLRMLHSYGIRRLESGLDLGREFIRPILQRQCELENIDSRDQTPWVFGLPRGPFAYRTMNGFVDSINVTPLPPLTEEVVLASDGFPDLRPTLAATLEKLDRVLESDPWCIDVFKSTKGRLTGQRSYDDMSYVRVEV